MSASRKETAFTSSFATLTFNHSFCNSKRLKSAHVTIKPPRRITRNNTLAQRPAYETGKIKTNTRVFVDETFTVGQTVTLSLSELRHLRARRTRAGATIILFNSSGYKATAILQGSEAAIVDVSQETLSRPSITAIIGCPKSPKRADWIVEKLTELGVTSIAFVDSARAVGKVTETKLQRWRRLAMAAAKQSLRTDYPIISEMLFDSVLEEIQRHRAPLLFCSGGLPLLGKECSAVIRSSSSALLLIGPEGGFDDAETELFSRAGALKIGLGNHRLRVETAAVVATGVISQLFIQSVWSSDTKDSH